MSIAIGPKAVSTPSRTIRAGARPEAPETKLAEPELTESELAEPELAEPELAEPELADREGGTVEVMKGTPQATINR
ncbi:MAG TPA: hypothetical protein VKZ46_01875 [Pedomonas sp.]|nr:hypothetical protein [Pedomonas sp.]